MLLLKLFDAESTSCEWTKRCISCSIQIEMFVTNHAQVSEGVCEGELYAIIEERGQIVSAGIIHITSSFNVLTVRDFLRTYASSLFSMVCMWLASLGMVEKVVSEQHMRHQKIVVAKYQATRVHASHVQQTQKNSKKGG